MGIHSLTQFLKTKVPNYKNGSIEVNKIKCMAIDAAQVMTSIGKSNFKFIADSFENPTKELTQEDYDLLESRFLCDGLMFCNRWTSVGITPLWVFDGKAPESKKEQQDARRKSRISAKNRYDELSMTFSASKEKSEGRTMGWVLDNKEDNDRSKLLSYRTQMFINPGNWKEKFKNMLEDIGIPWVQAKEEGEYLAFVLWKEGVCQAVLSDDTDLLAMGCGRVIYDNYIKNNTVSYYDYKMILSELNMNPKQFQDFCIMCGTDFNQGIHLIGPAKAYDIISGCGGLDNLPTHYKNKELDKSKLNIEECRRLFNYIPSKEAIVSQSSFGFQLNDTWQDGDFEEKLFMHIKAVDLVNYATNRIMHY